jgi:hypothetical protein
MSGEFVSGPSEARDGHSPGTPSYPGSSRWIASGFAKRIRCDRMLFMTDLNHADGRPASPARLRGLGPASVKGAAG